MDSVARWPAEDRRDLFVTASERRGNLSAEIIEKDFWVCWTLRRLFAAKTLPGLLFKGGTSLSKAYDAIWRFSEDVDLSFDRGDLGFGGEKDPANANLSGKQTARRIKELAKACRAHVASVVLPTLLDAFVDALGGAPGESWTLEIDERDPEGQTILFGYPAGLGASSARAAPYIQPVVRLEFGARSDHSPAEDRTITSYASEALPDAFRDARVSVHVLAAERTFWEKATILHAWYHAPKDKRIRDRQSRHYSDLASLYRSSIGEEAVGRLDLLESVAKHKKTFFASGWAKYDEARAGSLRLVPPEARRKELERDYVAMGEMFFDAPPSFDAVCEILSEIERRVNGG